MNEIAVNMSEGLLALAVGAGLQVMAALMEADVTELAGPKGRHDEARTAVRHGHERGSVTLGGRRVPLALMIDGVHFAESCCIVALGIGIDGVKHPLALVEGSTENATLVTELLVGLRERGLDVTRPMLVGLDGSKALRKAVLDVLDHPVIQRCQLHKIRIT